MKQPHWLSGSLALGNTTVYSQPTGTSDATPTTTETRAIFKVEQAMTIRNLVARLNAAPGGTATRTFTFRKNGADQAVTVTFGAADTTQSDTSNSFSAVAGDTVILKFTGANSPAASTFSLVWEGETSDGSTTQYAIGISQGTLGATNYLPLFSAGCNPVLPTVAAQGEALVGAAGTIPSYRIQLEFAPTSTNTRTFVIEKNGVTQDGTGGTPNTTITITGTATSGTATFSLAVVAGDLLRCKQTAGGSPGISRGNGTHTFVATTAGQMSVSSTPTGAPTISGTQYGAHAGGSNFLGSEVPQPLLPTPITTVAVDQLRVTLDAALDADGTHAYTLRVDSVDTAQTVSVASLGTGAGPSAGAAVDLSAGHVTTMKATTFSAATTNRPHWAMRGTVGTPPITSSGGVTFTGPAFAGSGTAVPPTITGTGGVSFGGPAFAGSGTATLPGIVGTGGVTFGGPALDGSGTFAIPPITGTGGVSFGGPALSGTGAVFLPASNVCAAPFFDPDDDEDWYG